MMHERWSIRLFFLGLFAGGLLLQPSVEASGSVAYENVAEILPVKVREHLEAAFLIPKVGDANRLGRHYTPFGGRRVAPYHFAVTSRASGEAMELTIYTEVIFYNGFEQPTEDPEEAKRLTENFVRYEVALSAAPLGDVALNQNEASIAITEARAEFQTINALSLDEREMELESDERWGVLSRSFDENGRARRARLTVGEGDHGASALDGFFDANGGLRFLLWEDSSWSFLPEDPEKTIDQFTEYRFYFSEDGRVAQVLVKHYSGSDKTEIAKNRDAAENTKIDPTVAPSPWLELSQIATAPPQELLDLLDVLADYRLSYTPD